MTKYEKRKETLLEALRHKTRMNIAEVSQLIGTSPATTRRFFNQIEKEKLAVRVLGGIQLIPQLSDNYSYSDSRTEHNKEKTIIASYAVNLIDSGDILFLSSGTTLLQMAKALAIKLKDNKLNNIVVATTSLISYEILAPYCKVLLTGGEVRIKYRDTFGYYAEKMINTLHFNKAFISIIAIDSERGFMATDERTFQLQDIVLKNSNSVFVLADSSKFGKTSLIPYGKFTAIDKIITDNKISEKNLNIFREKGANIEVVQNDTTS